MTTTEPKPNCPKRYAYKTVEGRKVREHVLVAEKALGRRLPPKAEVHHVDGNKLNNAPANLVVCQDRSYHFLLHARQRAYDATGSADALQCRFCQQHDAPASLRVRKRLSGDRVGQTIAYHSDCCREAAASRRAVA